MASEHMSGGAGGLSKIRRGNRIDGLTHEAMRWAAGVDIGGFRRRGWITPVDTMMGWMEITTSPQQK